MPLYTFENIKTGEIYENSMTIAEMEEYEKKNKHLRRVFKPISIVDPVGIGITKPPVDFQKGVLGKIKDKTKGSAIANKRWNIPIEI